MQMVNNLLDNYNSSQEKGNYISILIHSDWVLVNTIEEHKTIYYFHKNNVLSIKKNNSISKAKWHYVSPDYIRITSNNEVNVIKISFRNKHILTLDIDKKFNELAVFINESKSEIPLNTHDSVTKFLHNKYINKAKDIIHTHEYYYVEKSKEFGPFTVKELTEKVKLNAISSLCFVRDINEHNYSNRLRIRDLIKALD